MTICEREGQSTPETVPVDDCWTTVDDRGQILEVRIDGVRAGEGPGTGVSPAVVGDDPMGGRSDSGQGTEGRLTIHAPVNHDENPTIDRSDLGGDDSTICGPMIPHRTIIAPGSS